MKRTRFDGRRKQETRKPGINPSWFPGFLLQRIGKYKSGEGRLAGRSHSALISSSMNRLLRVSFFFVVAASAGFSADVPAPSALALWYDRPSEKWTDALPLGNGRLGAMVFGGVDHERVALN